MTFHKSMKTKRWYKKSDRTHLPIYGWLNKKNYDSEKNRSNQAFKKINKIKIGYLIVYDVKWTNIFSFLNKTKQLIE